MCYTQFVGTEEIQQNIDAQLEKKNKQIQL